MASESISLLVGLTSLSWFGCRKAKRSAWFSVSSPGPRTAGFAAGAVPDPLQQFMPLPRPRLDPNAPLVEPVPEPDPVAVDPPIEAAAIAEAAVEGDPVDDVDGSAVEVADVAIAEVEPADGASTVSIWLLLLAVTFAIGSFFLLRWGRISARAIAGAAWPSTLAAVVYSNVASETQRDRRGKEIVRFVPVVAYEYEIGGVTYRAARMRFGESSTADATAAKKIADRSSRWARGSRSATTPTRPATPPLKPIQIAWNSG